MAKTKYVETEEEWKHSVDKLFQQIEQWVKSQRNWEVSYGYEPVLDASEVNGAKRDKGDEQPNLRITTL